MSDADLLREPRVFTPVEELFINSYLAHGNATLAAREAGEKNANAFLKRPFIREELEIRRAKVKKTTGYTAEVAMHEARQGMLFAKRTNNANAYAKCVELRAKIMGLLVDRIDARLVGAFSIRIEGIDGPAIPTPSSVNAAQKLLAGQAQAAVEDRTPEEEFPFDPIADLLGDEPPFDHIADLLGDIPEPHVNKNPLNEPLVYTPPNFEELL